MPLHGTVCPECRVNWKYLQATGSAVNVGEYTCPKCGSITLNDGMNQPCPVCGEVNKMSCTACLNWSDTKIVNGQRVLVEGHCKVDKCKFEGG